MRLKRLKHDLAYGWVLFIRALFNLMPRRPAVTLGSGLGSLAGSLLKKDRLEAGRNLEKVYGKEIDRPRRDSIIDNMFKNFGKNLVDVMRLEKSYDRQIRPLIDTEGMEHFRRVYERGRGVVAVTGHIGNFELLAAFFASEGFKTAAIGRRMYDSRLDRLLVRNRRAMGIVNVATDDSPRRIMKLLKNGYALGALIDIDSIRIRSEFVPFLGRPAYTPIGQTILGLRAGAGFVPIVCVRAGKRYRIVVGPEITVNATGDFDDDVYNMTRECNRAIERIILEYPDQWIWIKNRWVTQPGEGQKNENKTL